MRELNKAAFYILFVGLVAFMGTALSFFVIHLVLYIDLNKPVDLVMSTFLLLAGAASSAFMFFLIEHKRARKKRIIYVIVLLAVTGAALLFNILFIVTMGYLYFILEGVYAVLIAGCIFQLSMPNLDPPKPAYGYNQYPQGAPPPYRPNNPYGYPPPPPGYYPPPQGNYRPPQPPQPPQGNYQQPQPPQQQQQTRPLQQQQPPFSAPIGQNAPENTAGTGDDSGSDSNG